VLEGRLELLSNDRRACHMVNIATLNGQVHLYMVHFVCEPQVVHMIEDQPAVEGDGQQEVVLGGENEGNDNEDGGIESYHNVNGDVKEEVDVESESQSPNNGDGDTGEEVVVEVGIEAHDNVNGMANEKAFVHGEEDLADNVNDEAYEDHVVECEIEAKHVFGDGEGEVGGEDPVVECEVEVEHIVRDGEEELGGKIDNEEDDEYEVSSWTKSEGDVMSGDELYDVRIERDDMEDELYDVRIEGHQVSGPSGSTRTKSQDTNVYDEGISDIEWEFETLESSDYSDTTNDDRDNYGHFGIFAMPKSMEDYKWEVGTYFAERKNLRRQ